MLRISIAIKNPSSLAGFEPVNRGSNGKHDYHYTTENNYNIGKLFLLFLQSDTRLTSENLLAFGSK
jgi:hypothetical protein